jgi:hypothetical protein
VQKRMALPRKGACGKYRGLVLWKIRPHKVTNPGDLICRSRAFLVMNLFYFHAWRRGNPGLSGPALPFRSKIGGAWLAGHQARAAVGSGWHAEGAPALQNKAACSPGVGFLAQWRGVG